MRSHPRRFRPHRRQIVTSRARDDRRRDECPSCGRWAVRSAGEIRANVPCRVCATAIDAIGSNCRACYGAQLDRWTGAVPADRPMAGSKRSGNNDRCGRKRSGNTSNLAARHREAAESGAAATLDDSMTAIRPPLDAVVIYTGHNRLS
jgi:hypothetical protein